MTRISSLNVAMRDEWKCSTEIGKMLPNERPTIILVHGDLSWDQVGFNYMSFSNFLQYMYTKNFNAKTSGFFNTSFK